MGELDEDGDDEDNAARGILNGLLLTAAVVSLIAWIVALLR